MLFANNGFVDVALWFELPILGAFAIDLPTDPVPIPALLTNLGLISLFGLQHSIMARPNFKKNLTKVLPQSLERSTYVLATALALGALIFLWQPMTNMIWQVSDPLLRNIITAVFWLGLVITFLATQMIDGLHLMGLRQSFTPDKPESTIKNFTTPAFYKFVRHPIQTGVIISMLATPDLSVGRAVLGLGIIIYIFVGLFFEERDLIQEFGDTYRNYKQRVPALIPFLNIQRK
jgi:protein-S-isoprenylcysteine O-methyltransferase Ste14